jgi:tetratricopeptide (TPR) repeat protein
MSFPAGLRSFFTSHRPHILREGVNVWRWLAVGICGALFVASIPTLWEVWTINLAGVMINRAVVQGSVTKGSAAEKDLTRAMDLMESAASHGPHSAGREIPIWRTYGVAASLLPSKHAYELLLRSRNAGRLDRIGELWLGEVASSTQNWKEAEKAYVRVDASNVLIHRAEVALQAGDKDLALINFNLAKTSLDAATERATARALLLDRTGNQPSVVSELMQNPGERVTSLYRIGRGIMNAGQPLQAVPILEQALEAAKANSPGTVAQQSIMLSLGLALAKTLPTSPDVTVSHPVSYFAIDPGELATVDALVRIRTLTYQGVKLDVTASACVQAGRILLLAADTEQAEKYLKKALDLDPRLAEAYLVLGARDESQGMTITARELYKKGVEMLPANVNLAAAYAITSYKTMPALTALPLLEHAASMDVKDPYVFAFLGDCYAELGMISQARASYQEGLRLFPGSTPLTDRLESLPNINRMLP